MSASSAAAISARRLPDAGKGDAVARHARLHRAEQFAARHHVHAGAQSGQRRQHGLVGIGLHRVADERRQRREGFGEDAVMALDRRRRIAIEGRADLVGDARQRHVFGKERAVAIGEMMHRRIASSSSKQGIEEEGRARNGYRRGTAPRPARGRALPGRSCRVRGCRGRRHSAAARDRSPRRLPRGGGANDARRRLERSTSPTSAKTRRPVIQRQWRRRTAGQRHDPNTSWRGYHEGGCDQPVRLTRRVASALRLRIASTSRPRSKTSTTNSRQQAGSTDRTGGRR